MINRLRKWKDKTKILYLVVFNRDFRSFFVSWTRDMTQCDCCDFDDDYICMDHENEMYDELRSSNW